jgi:hypothetical protein
VLGGLLIAAGAFTEDWIYQIGVVVFLVGVALIIVHRRGNHGSQR